MVFLFIEELFHPLLSIFFPINDLFILLLKNFLGVLGFLFRLFWLRSSRFVKKQGCLDGFDLIWFEVGVFH